MCTLRHQGTNQSATAQNRRPHKDPANHGFWNPLVLDLFTRMKDPHMHVVASAPGVLRRPSYDPSLGPSEPLHFWRRRLSAHPPLQANCTDPWLRGSQGPLGPSLPRLYLPVRITHKMPGTSRKAFQRKYAAIVHEDVGMLAVDQVCSGEVCDLAYLCSVLTGWRNGPENCSRFWR